MKKFGWAIIGCGGIANKVAKELVKNSNFEIVALWNRTTEKAEKFSKKFGGKVCQTAEHAIKESGVDCVYIATTHDKHLYYSKLAISLGVPVLCEKPVTVNAAQCEEILELAKEKGVYFAEAMWTWHNPVSLKVKSWIGEKRIGEVTGFKASFAVPMLQISRNKRLTSPELIGGALLDIGIYPVRYALELFGMPLSIKCNGDVRRGVDYGEKIIMDYGKFKAEIYVSMTKLKGESIKISGANGKISVPFYHKATRAKLCGKHKVIYKNRQLLYGLQLKNTAKEIAEGLTQSNFCPHAQTLDTMKLLDECRKQMGVMYPCENK